MKDYVNSAALQEYTTKLVAKLKTLFPGTPTAAATVADMTDHSKTYVYVGSETGYTAGDWYYWDGTAWTSGGPFQATSIITDTTLAVAGEAADAKATGDAIAAAKTAVLNAMAPAYSTSATYAVGDYVNYNGSIYRCTTAITTAESWTSGHWTAVVLGADLASQVSDLKTQLTDVESLAYLPYVYFEKITFTSGKKLTTSGSIENDNNYAISDYVLVKKGTTVCYDLYSSAISISNVGKFDLDKTNFVNIDSRISGEDAEQKGSYTATEDCLIVFCGRVTNEQIAYYQESEKTIPERIDELENTAQISVKMNGDLYGNIEPDFFEYGNITFGANGFTYSASSKTIRTPENYPLLLNIGDTIELTDYATYKLYVGWIIKKDDTTKYDWLGWITSGTFTAMNAGTYSIVVRRVDDANIDLEQAKKTVKIHRLNSYDGKISTNEIHHIVSESNIRDIAHRGYRTAAPENTIPAFALAKKMGYNAIELDVWPTLDNNYVVIHDSSVARTSDGTGVVYEMTLSQIEALDFGAWFSPNFIGTKCPTLEEAIEFCRSAGLKVYIELKHNETFTEWSQAQINDIVNVVKDCGMLDKVTWIDYGTNNLLLVANADNKARFGILVNDVPSNILSAVETLSAVTSGEVFVDANYPQLTSAGIGYCKSNNIPLEVYSASSQANIIASDKYISGYTAEALIPSVVLYQNSLS